MKKELIYDLPTRIFHWLFAALFVSAFLIPKIFDDESQVFPYHMILGLILAASVLLRIIWGFFGSTYARFSSFQLKPKDLITYLSQALKSKTTKSIGHNPASSYAAIIMMICSLGLAFSGYQMASRNNKEFYEEIHEIFANLFLVMAVLHIAGILFHTMRHKEAIGLSMIHGKKSIGETESGISSQYISVALVFVFLMAGISFNLYKNYDSKTATLKLLGKSLVLGEAEEGVNNDSGNDDDEGDDD